MRKIRINNRYIIYAAAALVLVILLVISAGLIRKQRYDGMRINLSGRQRMLTQKMSKEIVLYSQGLIGSGDVMRTMRLFDITLRGLTYGGDVPVDMEMNIYRHIPPAGPGVVTDKQQTIIGKWDVFSFHAAQYLETKDRDSLLFIIDENIRLLAEVDDAVRLMEESYEERTFILQVVIFSAVLMIILILAYMLVTRIRQVREARDEILKLERILPICANCKRIRGEQQDPYNQESWMNLEEYLKKEKDINFSHGLCPDCAEKLYPGLLDKK